MERDGQQLAGFQLFDLGRDRRIRPAFRFRCRPRFLIVTDAIRARSDFELPIGQLRIDLHSWDKNENLGVAGLWASSTKARAKKTGWPAVTQLIRGHANCQIRD